MRVQHFHQILSDRDAVRSKVRIQVENEYLSTFHGKPGAALAMLAGESRYSNYLKQYIFSHTFSGRHDYIEYVQGNIPIIISAPHGGRLKA
jgi:hypothetical protein